MREILKPSPRYERLLQFYREILCSRAVLSCRSPNLAAKNLRKKGAFYPKIFHPQW